MKFVRTGTGADGRSCVESVTELSVDDHSHLVASWDVLADGLPVLPDAASVFSDLTTAGVDIRPATVVWSVFCQRAGQSFGLHHTDSVDFDVVLSGSTRLSTETSLVELSVGDCVLIPGIAHRWDAGDDGCLLSVVLLGVHRRP